MISRYQDDPASLYDAGIDYAVKQLRDLIEAVPMVSTCMP